MRRRRWTCIIQYIQEQAGRLNQCEKKDIRSDIDGILNTKERTLFSPQERFTYEKINEVYLDMIANNKYDDTHAL